MTHAPDMHPTQHSTIHRKPPFPRAADDSSLNPTLTQRKISKLVLGVAHQLQTLGQQNRKGAA